MSSITNAEASYVLPQLPPGVTPCQWEHIMGDLYICSSHMEKHNADTIYYHVKLTLPESRDIVYMSYCNSMFKDGEKTDNIYSRRYYAIICRNSGVTSVSDKIDEEKIEPKSFMWGLYQRALKIYDRKYH